MSTVDTAKSTKKLNELLRGEISAVETYGQALGRIRDADARHQLEECKRSHQQRVEKLRRQIVGLGGQPANTSGPWGTFAKLLEGGAKAIGERAAIAALEEGEDHGVQLYRADLEELDSASRLLVETELLPAQERTHSFLSSLKHTER